jgi:hypothetical protein
MKPSPVEEKPKPFVPPVIPEKQVPDFNRTPERRWELCMDCKQEVFRESNGRTYYHGLSCKSPDKVRQDAEKYVRGRVFFQ